MDSLKVTQNPDGSYTIEWDREDPNWKFLNDYSSEEIEALIQHAINEKTNDSRLS
jgi:hypothetical protein